MQRLLLVEEDVLIGTGIQIGLRHESFEVDWSQDRQGAERSLRSGHYPVVVLDFALPRPDTVAIAKVLSQSLREALIVSIRTRADDKGPHELDIAALAARIRLALQRVGSLETAITL